MTFLAPGYLVAALVAAVGVVALHFIVTRRPRAVVLPTARFVPEAPVTATTRRIELSDLLLLLVRVLLVLAIGAALARPVLTPDRERVVRVIAADVSGSVARLQEVRDSVRPLLRPGDALVAFDTSARVVTSVDSLPASDARVAGSLSSALAAALRSGSSVRAGADSVELVIVSPLAHDEADRATAHLRALWPGRARLVRVTARADSTPATARVVWPSGADAPPGALARTRVDTAGAVVASGAVAVAPFERRWTYPADSLRGARVVARWADGDVAAIERESGAACVRSIAISVDSAGDIALRPDVARVREALSAPCGGARASVSPVRDSATVALITGKGALARTAAFPPLADVASPLARWLLIAAIALAVLELLLRAWRTREVTE